jgi:hypothetical protein
MTGKMRRRQWTGPWQVVDIFNASARCAPVHGTGDEMLGPLEMAGQTAKRVLDSTFTNFDVSPFTMARA